jgi:hypothetical protein
MPWVWKRRARQKARLLVRYYEDQEDFRADFKRRHKSHFDVEPEADVNEAVADLLSRSRKDLPDLLLLDLYHETDPSLDDEVSRQRVAEAEAAIDDLNGAVRRVKQLVDRAWSPVGIDVAVEIRRHFPAHVLPIMIYSQKGLFILDDEQMRRIEENQIDWMLKDSERFSTATEETWIRGVVDRSRSANRIPRDIRIAAWSVGAGLAGSVLTLLVQELVA